MTCRSGSDLAVGWQQARQLDGDVADHLKDTVCEAAVHAGAMAIALARTALGENDQGRLEVALLLIIDAAGDAERFMQLIQVMDHSETEA